MRTRNQIYADAAWQAIDQLPKSIKPKDYKRQCEKFPVFVLRAGLAQALGFVRSKAEADGCKYLEDLAGIHSPGSNIDQWCHNIYAASIEDYMNITREVLQAATWLKRIAQAQISDENEATQQGD
jgi:CRISPR-associated protein Cmr5